VEEDCEEVKKKPHWRRKWRGREDNGETKFRSNLNLPTVGPSSLEAQQRDPPAENYD